MHECDDEIGKYVNCTHWRFRLMNRHTIDYDHTDLFLDYQEYYLLTCINQYRMKVIYAFAPKSQLVSSSKEEHH